MPGFVFPQTLWGPITLSVVLCRGRDAMIEIHTRPIAALCDLLRSFLDQHVQWDTWNAGFWD